MIQGARPVQLGLSTCHGQDDVRLGYTNSKEATTRPQTTTFGISQDLFGDLTTITMGFSRGNDIVRRRDTTTNQIDPTFKEPTDRWSYRVGVSQILTKSLITTLQLEVITDEGFLNNPYRSYRYVNPTDDRLFALAREIYPRTRTSNRSRQRTLPPTARAKRLPLYGHGASTRTRSSSAIPIRGGRGRSRSATATTRKATPTSTATCSTARTSRTSWRATRSCRRSRARR